MDSKFLANEPSPFAHSKMLSSMKIYPKILRWSFTLSASLRILSGFVPPHKSSLPSPLPRSLLCQGFGSLLPFPNAFKSETKFQTMGWFWEVQLLHRIMKPLAFKKQKNTWRTPHPCFFYCGNACAVSTPLCPSLTGWKAGTLQPKG